MEMIKTISFLLVFALMMIIKNRIIDVVMRFYFTIFFYCRKILKTNFSLPELTVQPESNLFKAYSNKETSLGMHHGDTVDLVMRTV